MLARRTSEASGGWQEVGRNVPGRTGAAAKRATVQGNSTLEKVIRDQPGELELVAVKEGEWKPTTPAVTEDFKV